MEGAPHHCPGCGSPRPYSPRYPWHLCGACLAQATDAEGRPLEFSNASFSGGLVWRRPAGDWSDEVWSVRCLVQGRPVIVTEAHMGGVVAQPIPLSYNDARALDLTRPGAG